MFCKTVYNRYVFPTKLSVIGNNQLQNFQITPISNEIISFNTFLYLRIIRGWIKIMETWIIVHVFYNVPTLFLWTKFCENNNCSLFLNLNFNDMEWRTLSRKRNFDEAYISTLFFVKCLLLEWKTPIECFILLCSYGFWVIGNEIDGPSNFKQNEV